MHRYRGRTPLRPFCQPLEPRRLLSTYHVTTVNDDGAGSLRQAILDSNANPVADVIDFVVGAAGPVTLAPLSLLPEIGGPVTLDGTTQPGYAGKPIVEISGALAGGEATDGLKLTGHDNAVRGLVVNGWSGSGMLATGAGNNVFENNYFGTDVTGQLARPNRIHGLIMSGDHNRVGGPAAAQRNLFSANGQVGLFLYAANDTTIQGNYAGLAADGVTPLANGVGVFLMVSDQCLVGGTAPGQGNVISGNARDGLLIYSDSDYNTVQGNRIGTDHTGTLAVGNLNWGIELQGSHNLVGGTAAGALNLLSGNAFDGLVFYLGKSQFNKVQGNFIGTDITGTKPLGNLTAGVSFSSDTDVDFSARGPHDNLVGGTDPLERNIISANVTGVGVFNRTSFNTIQGNYIGLDVTGTKPLPNYIGVSTFNDSPHNTFGGTAPGAGNVISGNNGFGALVGSDYTTFEGNIIGLDPTGTYAIPNRGDGILTDHSSHNVVGGPTRASRNVISGNAGSAVHFSGGGANVVQNNDLGTLANGVGAAPNLAGVYGENSADNLVASNRIANNLTNGVVLDGAAAGNRITSNSMYANGTLGIDLVGSANHGQAFPVLTSAKTDGSATTLTGTLGGAPSATFTLDFYASPTADPSGFGEGRTFLGSATVTTDAQGNAAFTATVGLAPAAVGQVVSATATAADNSTSEFSAARTLTAAAPPAVAASGFAYLRFPHAVTFTFTQRVRDSIDVGDLSVAPLPSGTAFAPTALTYDDATNTVSFTLPRDMPDGNYRATLRAAGVRNAAGAALAADVSLTFFELRGDANHDRTVDFNDLVPLAQNYNTAGNKTWADGDFTGDDAVDFNDLVFVAQNYNTTLLPPAEAPPPPAPAMYVAPMTAAVTAISPQAKRQSPAPVFSAQPIAKPAPVKPKPVPKPRRR